ncbi:glutathione S-transferase U17-like [Salvia miltiorrhiza]|uniref:glutathione S-transferase U17-like n=1 Tax=Salvia miltiorrhiza TaxID=226208 RepID=UPI0025AC0E77|nr:glutathione S-transferase U17-like [Salvia miltiorrhiza]
MSFNEVKLLGSWQSPFAFRVRIALNIKSVAYDFQQEDVLVAKSDLLLQSNPVHKTIPVLIHNGRPICESLVIVQYIDQVWASGPGSILPSDPHDRAMARFWTSYIDDTWFKHLNATLLSQGEDARRKSHDETSKGLLVLEAALGCQNFFGGDRIGYVDVALGCFLPLISVIEKECHIRLIDEFKTPKLLKWAQHFSADAAVKDILPDTDELCECYRSHVSVIKGWG